MAEEIPMNGRFLTKRYVVMRRMGSPNYGWTRHPNRPFHTYEEADGHASLQVKSGERVRIVEMISRIVWDSNNGG